MVESRGGIISLHQSGCCLPTSLAYAHSYWDGEQLTSGDLSSDPLSALSLDTFRAEFAGANFGVPCEFLAYERPPQWTFDDALAVSMLHGVRVRPHGLNHRLETMSAIWKIMEDFKVAECEFIPYHRGKITTSHRSVKVSVWSHPCRGALAVISNLDPAAETVAEIDFGEMGATWQRAVDALNMKRLEYSGASLKISLPARRMRLIRLG
jgi:hypothetical protein